MYSCHSILERSDLFSEVKLRIRSFCFISPKNDCKSTYKCPNLINDISSKTYRSTESKEVKKL